MARNTLAEIADQGAENIAAAQNRKAEISVANKAIHKFGGEDAIIEFIASGGTISALCKVLGVGNTTFDRWVEKGGETRRAAYPLRAIFPDFSRGGLRSSSDIGFLRPDEVKPIPQKYISPNIISF